MKTQIFILLNMTSKYIKKYLILKHKCTYMTFKVISYFIKDLRPHILSIYQNLFENCEGIIFVWDIHISNNYLPEDNLDDSILEIN